MASGGRGERASRPRARPASVVVPITRPRGGVRLDAERFVPSGRSLALAFGLLAAVIGAWFAARETPMFALRSVEIAGAPEPVSRQVRDVLERERGTSLLRLDVPALARAVEKLPTVVSVSFDRAFPHALRVEVLPERPVLVVRQGAESWLVSARGRVMGGVARGTNPELPRLWVRRDVELVSGARLTGQPAVAVLAAAPLAAVDLPRVRTVQAREDGVTLTLRSGLLLRLGEPASIRLKLVIVGRILPLLGPDTLYVDVSVPDRPVSGTTLNSQVEVDGSTSTIA